MFRIGQKVVCVDARFPPEVWEVCEDIPERGKVYTVRDIELMGDYFTRVRGWALRLEEVRNPVVPPLISEAGFSITRFRPLTRAEERREAECAEGVEAFAEAVAR